MTISKPVHSESRTLWYVWEADDVVATLEIGQLYDTVEGATYRLVAVHQEDRVLVERCDRHYSDRSVWHMASLINPYMTLRRGVYALDYADFRKQYREAF